jgi:hypothetical protein
MPICDIDLEFVFSGLLKEKKINKKSIYIII